MTDILKQYGEVKAFKLPDNKKTRQMISDTILEQKNILAQKKIDWNDPNLHRPMDF